MNPVHTETEIQTVSKKAVEVMYGSNIENFKIRTLIPFPNEQRR